MERMIVNWVKEDEELLEPYEWHQGDDIEEISSMRLIKVDRQTLYDFIYGCLHVYDKTLYHQMFALGDGHYTIVVETDQRGKLIYRSVLDIESRSRINQQIDALDTTSLSYHMYDEGFIKEFGLTRDERIKKQYVENQLDELYLQHPTSFVTLCRQLGMTNQQPIQLYFLLKKKIEKGYTFLHNVLYEELKKTQYK